jgi:hypothetical protein
MTHYLRALAARLRGLFGDRRAERDLDEEIEAHLRLLTERYVRHGMTETEAAPSRRSRTLARSGSSQSAARVGTRDASDRVADRGALEKGSLAGSWPGYLEVSFVFTTFCKVSTTFLQFYTV